ncbi:MAG: MarR family winged helix-turn-helix transcriptional regulator [Patescibacteria group bacterium]
MDNTIEDKIIDLIMEMKTHFIYGNNFISSALLLRIISENKHIRVVDLSRKMNISPPSVTEALSKLENQGFIHKEEGNNKREKIVSITDHGREKMKEFSKLLRSEMKDKIGKLSKEDKLVLKDNLSLVVNTLKKI